MLRSLRIGAALLLMAGAAAGIARAECYDYDQGFHWASVAPSGEGAETVALQGNLCLVGGTGPELRILDLAHPSLPQLLGTLPTPGVIVDIEITDDYAVLGILVNAEPYDQSALWTVDFSDPHAPVQLGGVVFDGTGDFVDLAGQTAYFENRLPAPPEGDNGLVGIDLSDPANPALLGRISFGAYYGARAVTGNLVHGTHNLFGETSYWIQDISDFANPVSLGSIPGDGIGFYSGLWTTGHHAFVESDAGVAVIDFADPSAPAVVGSIASGQPQAMAFAGDRAYLADTWLRVLDIANPTSPQLLFVEGGAGRSLATSGDLLCSALGTHGLLTVDVGDGMPASPLSTPLTTTTLEVASQGAFAYAVGTDDYFRVLDVSDLTQPLPRGTLYIPGDNPTLVVRGDLAYVLDWQQLRIIDVSNPDLPQVLGVLPLSDLPTDLVIQGDRAYASRQPSGFHTIDISNPSAPSLLHTATFGVLNVNMAVSGDAVYLGDFINGIIVVDNSNPLNPVMVTHLTQPVGEQTELAIADDALYVSAQDSGLLIYDISSPLAPVQVAVQDFGASGVLDIAGDRMTLRGGRELLFLDRTDPLDLKLLGSASGYVVYTVAQGAEAIFAAGAAPAGLQIFPLACTPTAAPDPAPAPVALRAWPNPFNPQVTLEFSLATPAHGTLEIYDVAGRRLATVAAGSFAAGENRAVWEGRDESGQALPSGVYFARLAAGDARANWKLVLLR